MVPDLARVYAYTTGTKGTYMGGVGSVRQQSAITGQNSQLKNNDRFVAQTRRDKRKRSRGGNPEMAVVAGFTSNMERNFQ